jgi:hypothetical protein
LAFLLLTKLFYSPGIQIIFVQIFVGLYPKAMLFNYFGNTGRKHWFPAWFFPSLIILNSGEHPKFSNHQSSTTFPLNLKNLYNSLSGCTFRFSEVMMFHSHQALDIKHLHGRIIYQSLQDSST